MKIRIAAALSALVLAAAPCLAASPRSQVVEATWQVSLDADGRVTQVAARSTEMPKLYAYLEDPIRSWRFSPGQVDGRPVATQTYLHLVLEIATVGQNAEVRVRQAFTGGDYGQVTRVVYPEQKGLRVREGAVKLRVRYDESGAVVGLELHDKDRSLDDRFVQLASSSVKKWTFLPEVVDGHALAGDVLVPVCFQPSAAREPESCQVKIPAAGESASAAEAFALNPAAKLETDVIGRAL